MTAAYTYNVFKGRTGETPFSAFARTFGYDLTGQLTAVNQSSGNAVFAYDPVGNRTVATDAPGAGNYTANNLNQYTTAGGVGPLTYDANGNLATGGGWTYTHNGSSRLVGVSGPGSVTAAFGRDGRNRDVKRTINGTTTYLIYDGWNLVAEYDVAGVLTTRYIHGPQVDEILAKVTTTSTTFPLPDALGSTIAVTDASGAVLERVYYSDAFGTPTFQDAAGSPLAGTSTGTRFLFTGREWLAALNLYDYRNRTYSAELGRFIETDPIGFDAGDVNLYRYVSNAPLDWMDPRGLQRDAANDSNCTRIFTYERGDWEETGAIDYGDVWVQVRSWEIASQILPNPNITLWKRLMFAEMRKWVTDEYQCYCPFEIVLQHRLTNETRWDAIGWDYKFDLEDAHGPGAA
jgi:RHS repeat-associated protein